MEYGGQNQISHVKVLEEVYENDSMQLFMCVLHFTTCCFLGLCTNSVMGPTAAVIVTVGVVCSLVFLIVGVLLGVVSVYLIQRVRGRLSGPTSTSPPPLPPPATYEEVGVAGEKSHDIQLTSNESYSVLQKNLIPTSPNTAYSVFQTML